MLHHRPAEITARKPTFDLRSTWHLKAQPEELTAIVLDAPLLAAWCRTVFMEADTLDPGDGRGLGMHMRVYTKGWLPHSFVFQARVTEIVPHRYMLIEVDGDFEGFTELEVVPEGEDRVRAEVRWCTTCRHPFIGPLTRLARLPFALNHKWALRIGSGLMQREIDRRRARLGPLPAPKPTFPHNVPVLRAFFNRRRLEHFQK